MKFYMLPLFLLMSAVCFGADQGKARVKFVSNDDTESVKRDVKIEEERVCIRRIYVKNETPHKLIARAEGFGIVDTNGKKKEYNFMTGGVDIPAGGTGCLQQTDYITQYPIKSVLYTLYTSVLMVRIASEGYGDINSEAFFQNPFAQRVRNRFLVTGFNFKGDIGYQLVINNEFPDIDTKD